MTDVSNKIAKIKEAIALGATSITYKNRTITYRSLDEMRSILSELEQEAGTKKSGRRRTTISYDNGL